MSRGEAQHSTHVDDGLQQAGAIDPPLRSRVIDEQPIGMGAESRAYVGVDALTAWAVVDSNPVLSSLLGVNDYEAPIEMVARSEPLPVNAAIRNPVRSQDEVADALMAAFSEHRATLFAIARRYVGSDLATDVVQEVIARAWRDRHRFDQTRGSWRAYLVVLTRGVSIDALRQTASRQRREQRDHATRVDSGADELLGMVRHEESFRLSAALDVLGQVERELVIDAFYGTENYRQLADRLGLPVGTVKSRIRTALHKLRHALVDLRNDETQMSSEALQRSHAARAAIEGARHVIMETAGAQTVTTLNVIGVDESMTEDEPIDVATDIIGNVPIGRRAGLGRAS